MSDDAFERYQEARRPILEALRQLDRDYHHNRAPLIRILTNIEASFCRPMYIVKQDQIDPRIFDIQPVGMKVEVDE